MRTVRVLNAGISRSAWVIWVPLEGRVMILVAAELAARSALAVAAASWRSRAASAASSRLAAAAAAAEAAAAAFAAKSF